ncbi:MAG: hypothetical protein WBX00_23575, partial [Isosphaeraceae bacterium]
WAEIKMPRPGEDRSDVGGAAQFNNIGPVPLSVSSRFPFSDLDRQAALALAGSLPEPRFRSRGPWCELDRWEESHR